MQHRAGTHYFKTAKKIQEPRANIIPRWMPVTSDYPYKYINIIHVFEESRVTNHSRSSPMTRKHRNRCPVFNAAIRQKNKQNLIFHLKSNIKRADGSSMALRINQHYFSNVQVNITITMSRVIDHCLRKVDFNRFYFHIDVTRKSNVIVEGDWRVIQHCSRTVTHARSQSLCSPSLSFYRRFRIFAGVYISCKKGRVRHTAIQVFTPTLGLHSFIKVAQMRGVRAVYALIVTQFVRCIFERF